MTRDINLCSWFDIQTPTLRSLVPPSREVKRWMTREAPLVKIQFKPFKLKSGWFQSQRYQCGQNSRWPFEHCLPFSACSDLLAHVNYEG